MKTPEFMFYPEFNFIEERGQFLPQIRLPEDYLDLVKSFYNQGRKEDVEEYSNIIEKRYLKGELEVKLNWD